MSHLYFMLVMVCGLSLVVEETQADCCSAVVGYGMLGSGMCRDCFRATPCCGIGTCNAFCCGCAGGCRQGDCLFDDYLYDGSWGMGKRDTDGVEHREAKAIFNQLDSNGDGKVVEQEADAYFLNLYNWTITDVKTVYDFGSLDKNGDHLLSLDEIDPK